MVFIVLVVLLSPQCILGNSISILSKLTPLDYYGQLFAVVGGSSCAETLAYGPLSVTQSGASGYPLFFSTQLSSFVHSRWLEIVTSDGTTELFRIYWQFNTARTLANHFMEAVYSGVAVNYRVVDTAGVGGSIGTEYTYSATWRFSSTSTISSSEFTVSSVGAGFSGDDAPGVQVRVLLTPVMCYRIPPIFGVLVILIRVIAQNVISYV
jgi:hypothetical protein